MYDMYGYCGRLAHDMPLVLGGYPSSLQGHQHLTLVLLGGIALSFSGARYNSIQPSIATLAIRASRMQELDHFAVEGGATYLINSSARTGRFKMPHAVICPNV